MSNEQTITVSVLVKETGVLRDRIRVLESELADQKQLRQELRTQHSFRKAIIEHAAEGVCVCHAIPDYPYVRFTVWNPRMTQITGYTVEEINRLGWYQAVYPDPEVQKLARERMERMRQGEDLEYEHWEITRADDRIRTVGISTSILTTDDGEAHVLALMQDITEQQKYHKNLERRVKDLQKLLPICASCKKIRDDAGYWHQVEEYIMEHFETVFTHGLCPECADTLYSELP